MSSIRTSARLRPRFPWTVVAGLVATLLLPVVVVAGSVCGARALTALPSDAALRAAGVTVTRSELKQQIRVLGALYGLHAPADPAQTDHFNRATAQAVALRVVIDKAIAERHLTVNPARSRQLLADFIATGINPPGQAAFLALLRDVGASEQDVVDELNRQEGTRELYRQVTAPAAAPISEAELRAYYQSHQAQMARPEQRHLRNIVVETQDQAAALIAEIRAGADFSAVAKQSSLDQKTRDAGGDLGTLTADELQDSYRAAAFAAPPGSVFGPLKTPDGWNVGQVLEVRPLTPVSFEDVHDQLATWMQAQRVEQTWRSWLAGRVAEADVRYADEYRPADPAALDNALSALPPTTTTPAVPDSPR